MPILISFLAAIAPFMRVAQCESNITNAVNPAGYYGFWQWDRRTWEADTGLPGVASDYSFYIQFEVTVKLQRERGWEPWPYCGRFA